jgi:single-strand DNA-binding protein
MARARVVEAGAVEAGDAEVPAVNGRPGTTHRNQVTLVGRLAAEAEAKTMPSGDELLQFRLVVERPPQSGRDRAAADKDGRRRPTIDTVDCVVWRPGVRRVVGGWRAGDVAEVVGSLQRRFWRSATGPVSRCEVVVTKARRITRA